MKRLTLEATDENILNSIKNNAYDRNQDVKDFVESLDTIEGNMFISLDARWGEGKTFYVREIEKTLEYVTKRDWEGEKPKDFEILESYFKGTNLKNVALEKSYLPIYYNAWLYDHHDDPLMSLVSVIVKKYGQYLDTDIHITLLERIGKLLSSVSAAVSYENIQVGINGEKVVDAFKTDDILKKIVTAEEIRQSVKNILNEVIVEKAQRLVIFIDELDRCRPTYAIEMLERIKHYFDDDRIIFVVSVNKEQLIHTISRYYGNGFDSTGYLNKFFDLDVHMPVMNASAGRPELFEAYRGEQARLIKISRGLARYYKLTLRELLAYKQVVSDLPLSLVEDFTPQGCCLSLFVPIIAVLNLKDENEKMKFLDGSSDILDRFAREVPEVKDLFMAFGDRQENALGIGLQKFQTWYKYAFKGEVSEENYELVRKVSADLKRVCIKLCNKFK